VTRTEPRGGAAPPFLVGLALALATQVGAGLLLYGGPGFLPALSVVLATSAGSMALGLASAPGRLRLRSPVEAARREWLLLLLALTGAAFFSAGWEIFRGFGARALAQGAGLALMVALPLYLGGRLLALLDPRHAGIRAPGPPVLAGAATGFLLLAHLLFPTLSPTAVLLICVVAVSGGALAHGWVLDEVVHEVISPVAGEELRIRHARRVRPLLDRLTVESPARVHLVRRGDGAPLLPVDTAFEGDLLPSLSPPDRVLAVGWRVVPAAVRTVPATARILLHTPGTDRVRPLLPLLAGPSGEVPHHLEMVPAHGQEPADWVLVDAKVLEEALDPPWPRLRRLVRPGGILIVVGVNEGPDGQGLLGPLRNAGVHFGGAAAYVGPVADGSFGVADGPSGVASGTAVVASGPFGSEGEQGSGRDLLPARREGILVFSDAPRPAWPERLGGLLLVLPEGDAP
jgi:hypothetical protein